MIQPRKLFTISEHVNGNILNEYDWNSVKKDALRFSDKI